MRRAIYRITTKRDVNYQWEFIESKRYPDFMLIVTPSGDMTSYDCSYSFKSILDFFHLWYGDNIKDITCIS